MARIDLVVSSARLHTLRAHVALLELREAQDIAVRVFEPGHLCAAAGRSPDAFFVLARQCRSARTSRRLFQAPLPWPRYRRRSSPSVVYLRLANLLDFLNSQHGSIRIEHQCVWLIADQPEPQLVAIKRLSAFGIRGRAERHDFGGSKQWHEDSLRGPMLQYEFSKWTN